MLKKKARGLNFGAEKALVALCAQGKLAPQK